MTISSSASRISYNGDGSTTAFAFPYEFQAGTDLKVYKDGVLQTITTHYTVSGGGGASGTVTFVAAPAAVASVVIYDDPPATQLLDYIANDPFPAESHEGGLDKATRLIRRLKDRLDRTVRLSDSDVSGASTIMPTPEANSFLAWNDDGDELINVDVEDVVTIAGSENKIVDLFSAGSEFTAGVTTTLTLSQIPGAEENVMITFDGVVQHHSTYSISGTVVTFSSAIPVGVAEVEAQYTRTLAVSTAASENVTWIQSGTGAVTRNVRDKLREMVSITDLGAATTSSDCSAQIQAVIDASPSTGREIYVPPGTFRAHGLKLQGTDGSKSNIVLVGAGFSSQIKSPTASSLNVIEGTAGSGHGLKNLRISGSKDTGGTPVRPPSRGFWVTGASYVVGDTVEVSSLDAATTTVAASNLVYRCTANNTAGATFAGDKAAYWVISSDPNFNTADLSYRYRNGVYLDGVSNCVLDTLLLDQHVYAGVNPGSGPVQAANIGPGSDRVRMSGLIIANCENGMAGGKWRDHECTDIMIYDCDEYGAVIDIDSARVDFKGFQAVGCGNHAWYAYDAQRVTLDGYTISGCLNGIVAEGGATLLEIGDGQITECTNNAAFFRGVTITQIGSMLAHANVKGIEFDTCSQIKVSRATANACTGSSGIKATSCSLMSFGETQAIGNSSHGIELQSCDGMTLNNVTGMNNTGAGVYGNNTTNVTVTGGSQLVDTRAGGSRTQTYGVQSAGTSANWSVVANRITNNVTANISLAGSGNTDMLNNSPVSVDRIGSAVAAAAVAANFGAETIITVRDINGTTRYVPAKNAPW